MIRRLKNLDPNLRYKFISLILAITIWYVINYFSDPAIRMTVNNVPVEILHGEVIENRGDVYTVLDNTDVIPVVTLQGKRSVIDKLEAKNIIATADVRDMEEDGSVRIVLTTDKYNNSIERITGSISNVSLRVEPQKKKSVALDVETRGEPAGGYILYEASAEQNQVDLTGPQSYVDAIHRAVARVDITDAERSINSYPEIVLYDTDGEEINKEEMSEHKLRLNISSVKVSASIYQTKNIAVTCGSEVPLADGYELDSVPAAEPDSILVAGAAGILRENDSITIPAGDIATEPVSSNIHKSIDLSDYLPEGLIPVDDNTTVTVYIRVRRIEAAAADTAAVADTTADPSAETTAEP